jgi:GH25 family lysozyme M1 (1,4-beta-N-acetylmuramidase)
MEQVLGIDIAWPQGPKVDFDSIAKTDIMYIVSKAAHGLKGIDPTFKRNYEETKRISRVRGRYCWYVPEQDPEKQADRFVEVGGELDPDTDLPISIDFEEKTQIPPKENLARVLSCVKRVRKLTKRKPILYTGKWYWYQYTGDDKGLNADSKEMVANAYLWHAEYPRKSQSGTQYNEALASLGKPSPARPWASRGTSPLFWQFDGDGGLRLPQGTDSDFNRFIGTYDLLLDVIRDSHVEEEATDEDLFCVDSSDIYELSDVQEELMLFGEVLPKWGADGKYGDETRDALISFQGKNCLTPTGQVDPPTLVKLNELRRVRLGTTMCE